jgi:hypothetical protein
MKPWIGVDLDGTLAYYYGWAPSLAIGDPIPEMVSKVKKVLEYGYVDVRIFTARVNPIKHQKFSEVTGEDITVETVTKAIEEWCLRHLGRILEVTDRKDIYCIEIWDNRARQVINNTGYFLGEEVVSR